MLERCPCQRGVHVKEVSMANVREVSMLERRPC